MQEQMTPEKAAQARRAAWWKMTKAWGEASSTVRIMAGPYVVPMIETIEAMAAEIEALHSAQRDQARALCHSCGVLSLSELQPAPAPAPACKHEGCNYPEGECEAYCMTIGKGANHG